MTCNQVRARALVDRYLAGELEEDETSGFEIHYINCERCFADLHCARHSHKRRAVSPPPARREPLPSAKTWLLWLAPIAAAGALGVMAAMVWENAAQPTPAASHTPATVSSRQ